jgi:hypothetical protein
LLVCLFVCFIAPGPNALLNGLVVTEKLDGGNCAFRRSGELYARTHSHEADKPWFDPLRSLLRERDLCSLIPSDSWVVFGEVMTAVHSIEYARVPRSHVFLFGIYDESTEHFLSWPTVEWLAARLQLPTVPVVARDAPTDAAALARFVEAQARRPSALDGITLPEGFVVRVPGHFHKSRFQDAMAKYVRANHVQTNPDFVRTWKKQNIVP